MSALTHATAPARRTRPFVALLRTELKLFVREPMALFWGVLFPVVLLVVLGLASGDKPQKSLGGMKLIVAYTPIVMVFVLAILSLSALPAVLASYRDKGYLRRLSTTPVGAIRLLGAQLLMQLGVIAVTVIAIAIVARVAFDVPFPQQLGGFILAMLLGAAAMLALGTLVSAVAPSQRAATIIGSMLFFPLMFFAGLWVPRAEMGPVLRDVSDYTPLGATVAAVQQSLAGQWPSASHLAVLAGWAVVLCLAASRLFRWER
jgi:ABC-2 type transport system permease protein